MNATTVLPPRPQQVVATRPLHAVPPPASTAMQAVLAATAIEQASRRYLRFWTLRLHASARCWREYLAEPDRPGHIGTASEPGRAWVPSLSRCGSAEPRVNTAIEDSRHELTLFLDIDAPDGRVRAEVEMRRVRGDWRVVREYFCRTGH